MDPVLIIGQGIAGSVLALRFYKAGIPFLVIDDGHKTSSSTKAAGLYNALVYKRGNLTWRANDFFQECEDFYAAWEKELKKEFLHKTSLYRRIHDAEEYNDWSVRKADPERAPFIEGQVSADSFPSSLNLPFGLCKVKGGWLDVNLFLRSVKAFLIDKKCYECHAVNLSELEPYAGTWRWQKNSFSKVILCTGYRSAQDERYFPDLPFSLAKGHLLTIKAAQLQLNKVINANVFIIPLGEDLYKVGSTFSWKNLNEEVEEEEVEKLVNEFKRLCSSPFEIINEEAGVRPAVQDQQPLIGESQKYRGIWHFGGFGSRAVLTCPVLASQFIELLKGEMQRDPEVDINRTKL